MRVSASIWSQCLNRLFGNKGGSSPPGRAGQRRRAKRRNVCAAEVMESRELLSATFGNALTFGNDTGSSSANDVATDAAGNSYMTGSFSGKVDFDPGAAVVELTALGSTDAYVAKYAKDNTLLWVQRMGGDAASVDSSGTDVGRQIEIDGSGNVYVVGEFIGAADFGSTILSTAGTDRDGFVAKLDAGGTVLWANRWGTAAEDYGRGGVGVDSAGNVYAAGVTGSSLVTNTGYDILKFSASGSQLWSKSIVAPQQIATADLAVDSSGNAFLAGSFKGTVDFDPSSKTRNVTVATSSPSGFVLKLNTSGTYKWVTSVRESVGWFPPGILQSAKRDARRQRQCRRRRGVHLLGRF